jgi:hypothetical protein
LKVVFEKLGMSSSAPKRPEPIYSFFPIYSPFKVSDNAGFDMGADNRLRRIFIKNGRLQFEMRSVLRPGRFLGNHYIAFTIPNRTFIITMDRVKAGMRAARKNKKIAVREKKIAAQSLAEEDYAVRRAATTSNYLTDPGPELAPRRRFFPFFDINKKQAKPKSFFSRFVEGYTLLERQLEANNERLTNEISDWFGSQGSSSETEE